MLGYCEANGFGAAIARHEAHIYRSAQTLLAEASAHPSTKLERGRSFFSFL